MKLRLEYSEKHGLFHFDDGGHPPNKFGWMTIHEALSDDDCITFAEAVEKRYPGKSPTLRQVKRMFAEMYVIENDC